MSRLQTNGILFSFLLFSTGALAEVDARNETLSSSFELGSRLYLEGIRPSGETITGRVRGDIELSGKQVICGTCHRRSGMGSSEGDQVIPAVAGKMIFNPLRLPTSSDPMAPTQRPAYSEETLKRAIRLGIDSNGLPLDPLMPRYPLSDRELDLLIGYLKTLSREQSPGVGEKEIHFATIIAGDVSAESRKALTDVMRVYAEQKNRETRHETFRAENAPWHKQWLFGPYRKWVIHVWELEGPGESWPEQLRALYEKQPVFAVLSGVGEGSWRPVHNFCQTRQLPCLFPTTELPVVDEKDFYPIYLSKGMSLEGELVDLHLSQQAADLPLVQVFRQDDLKGRTAAEGLSASRESVDTQRWDDQGSVPSVEFWQGVLQGREELALAVWMNAEQLTNLWPLLERKKPTPRIYLSSTLFGTDAGKLPVSLREHVFLTHTRELPDRTARLLMRSTGWFRMKHIYAPKSLEIQSNAYLALKVAGDALVHIRGYFFRDYLIERIEHTVDNVPYTSVYPRISLAPGQRFAAKGGYITQFSPAARAEIIAVSDWMIP
ncbi:MAG: hypothetical protein P8166_02415 [Candidatus Thiodiazotropha sp.]